VSAATFSADGRYVVTSSHDKTAQVWETTSGNPIGNPLQHDGAVVAAEFSPDGSHVVTASLDRTARLWETYTSTQVGKPLEHDGPVISARFSPDGNWVATTSRTQTSNAQIVQLWGVRSGTRKTVLKLEGWGPVSSVVFRRDGKRIVTLSADNIARLWETDTGNLIAELRGHQGAINTAGFTPDMQWLITAGDDRTVRLWDANTGDAVQVLRGHSDRIYGATGVAGNKVITVSRDGVSRTYTCEVCASPERLIELAGARVKRRMDDSERRKYRL
jgi:WD40 repeat protein